MEAKVLPNALGSNVANPMFKENTNWYLLHVIFVTYFFFRFSLYLRKEICFERAAENALTK